MGMPPVSMGAVHSRLIVVCPDAVAVRSVGASGAVAAVVVVLTVYALCPTELTAYIAMRYSVLALSPVAV